MLITDHLKDNLRGTRSENAEHARHPVLPSEPRVLSVNALVEDLSRMLARLIGEDIHMHTRLEPALGLVRDRVTE